jgi:hypothetical protein
MATMPTYGQKIANAIFAILKGQSHEIFDPRFFWLNGTPGCPDSWAKAVLNIDSNSLRNSIRIDYENRLRAMPHSADFLLDNAKLNKILF